MSLFQKIQDDVKTAMKAREKEKVSVLRMILSELKYELAKMEASELSDDQTIKICSTYHKRLDKSLADFPEKGATGQDQKRDVDCRVISSKKS